MAAKQVQGKDERELHVRALALCDALSVEADTFPPFPSLYSQVSYL